MEYSQNVGQMHDEMLDKSIEENYYMGRTRTIACCDICRRDITTEYDEEYFSYNEYNVCESCLDRYKRNTCSFD